MNHKETFRPSIGPTKELDLRVSVATLVRVLFEHPRDGSLMLALERKATLHQNENGGVVEIKSQPFGGAIRILDVNRIHDLIGDFHFDSEHSRTEQDFRILIRSFAWKTVRAFCLQQFNCADGSVFETDPVRELTEEFEDALNVSLKPEQYRYQSVATVVEDHPSPTENIHSANIPTVRIYRVFEASITDVSLIDIMIKNSDGFSNQALCQIALENARSGGKGRAHAILVLQLKPLTSVYLAMSPYERNAPILFGEHRLDQTVTTILGGIAVPKYQRI
jgi:hypothetical protein